MNSCTTFLAKNDVDVIRSAIHNPMAMIRVARYNSTNGSNTTMVWGHELVQFFSI